jgi:hypothetical protein
VRPVYNSRFLSSFLVEKEGRFGAIWGVFYAQKFVCSVYVFVGKFGFFEKSHFNGSLRGAV